jgi:hypothetical protein
LAILAHTGRVPAAVGPLGAGDDPEAVVVAADLQAKIRLAADEVPHGTRCLHGMLAGETIPQTATAAGVSVRTVKRARRQIRAATRQIAWPS